MGLQEGWNEVTPTSRTFKFLKEGGYQYEKVERWNPFSKTRKDFIGVIDILCWRFPLTGVLGIQATSATNSMKRLRKAMEEARLHSWLRCGNRFEVWSWGKRGPRGKRKEWTLTRREILLCDDKIGWTTLDTDGATEVNLKTIEIAN